MLRTSFSKEEKQNKKKKKNTEKRKKSLKRTQSRFIVNSMEQKHSHEHKTILMMVRLKQNNEET